MSVYPTPTRTHTVADTVQHRPHDLLAHRIDTAGLTACAVSMRGTTHLRDGLPRQDHLGLVETTHDWVLAVVADGVGSRRLSHHGAAAVTRAVTQTVLDEPAAIHDPELLVDAAVSAIHETALALDADPDDFSTTLTIAAIPRDPEGTTGDRLAVIHQIGDSPVLLLTDTRWSYLTPEDDAPSNVVQSWLPGRPDVISLEATVPAEAVILACTDGLAIPMGPDHGNGELGTALADRWSSGPRETVQFVIDLAFTGYGDDRTGVAIWTAPIDDISPAPDGPSDQ